MNKTLRQDFQKFLAFGGYCTPPGRTACALRDTRALAKWREAESAGLVRLVSEPDDEPYDAGDTRKAYVNQYGRHVSAEEASAEVDRMLERDGVWNVRSEWFDGETWQPADAICGCNYSDPEDPFDNPYVIDLMHAALEALPSTSTAYFERFALELPSEAVTDCSHPGECDGDVARWATRIPRPSEITPERLAAELKEYGAWDAEELADDEANWHRIVWLAAGKIRDERA